MYKLKKALYGLKQAPRAWYIRIHGYFKSVGFQTSVSEPSLYFNKNGTDILIIYLYVDDLIFMDNNNKINEEFQTQMMVAFKMKDLGLMSYFLGLEVHQMQDEIFVSRTKYVKDMLKKFKMENCTSVEIPIAHGEDLCKEDGKPKVNKKEYRSIVGSLMFLTNTRSYLQFSVSLMERYMSDPSIAHLNAAKGILRYVKGTIDYGIHYECNSKFKLSDFSDSDWGNDLDD